MQPCVYTNTQGRTLSYRLGVPQFPETGRRYPMLLFLHGSGECGTDNLKQIKVGLPALLNQLLKSAEQMVIVAPQCQAGNWWVAQLARSADYAAPTEPTDSMAMSLELCRGIIAQGLVDPDRVYITGLSLGGFGVWDAIQREPEFFAAAVPICGGGDIRRVNLTREMPVWVFHGVEDKNVSVECSRRMVSALRESGNRRVKYTEYEKAGHNVWDRAYANPELTEWLLRQTRKRRPWWRIW